MALPDTRMMPALFLSHGGPNVVTDPSDARDFLGSLSGLMSKPTAIVTMSAHFETDGVAVVSDRAPETLHDFGGFAPELHEMMYPAPGDPVLAERLVTLLETAGLAPKRIAKRGFDHGVWNPLILGFPEADIPVVQVSVDPGRDAAWHHGVGAALSSLRQDGVLLLGSGHITHNLRAVFSAMRGGIAPDADMTAKVDAFTSWIADVLAAGDHETLLAWREAAPHVADNHPTDEHLMPLFFAAGAGGPNAQSTRIHASRQYGFFAWDAYRFD